jgi:hypothetical protein
MNLPAHCAICSRWFVPSPPCLPSFCEECDVPQSWNNLCGACSGVGPLNQKYVESPSPTVANHIHAVTNARVLERKKEAEERQRAAALAKEKRDRVLKINRDSKVHNPRNVWVRETVKI